MREEILSIFRVSPRSIKSIINLKAEKKYQNNVLIYSALNVVFFLRELHTRKTIISHRTRYSDYFIMHTVLVDFRVNLTSVTMIW